MRFYAKLLCALDFRIKSTVYLFDLNGINIRFNNLNRERNGKGSEESE